MNSRDYWSKRSALDMVEYMRSAEQTAALMEKAGKTAAAYITKQTKGIFSAFKSFGISESEARRVLSAANDKTALQALRAAAAKIKDETARNALTEAINSAGAYRYRIDRLEEVSRQITQTCNSLYKTQLAQTTSCLSGVASSAYYHTIFNLQQQTGLAFSFAQFPQGQVERLLKTHWTGDSYSQRIWKNTNALADRLKDELLIGLMSGRSDAKTARVIQEAFQSNSFCARRLVRTESAYVANAAVGKGYDEAGIERYIFVATLDAKTSEVCAELDGKSFDRKDAKPGTNYPPMHPWCRSTTIADLGKDTLKNLERRAKDENGNTVKVPASQSYEEWYKQNVEGSGREQITIAAPLEDNSQFSRSPSINREVEREFTRRPNRTEPFDITAFRVDNTNNNIFISGNVTIMTKPKNLHDLDLRISESLKLLNSQGAQGLPSVCIASVDEMVNNVAAAYNVVDNIVFINEALFRLPTDSFACPNSRLSTILHEYIHWKDAADYRLKFGAITTQNYRTEYLPYLNQRCRLSLDKLEKKGYNIYEISKYASDSYDLGKYDETYTEYLVSRILKG